MKVNVKCDKCGLHEEDIRSVSTCGICELKERRKESMRLLTLDLIKSLIAGQMKANQDVDAEWLVLTAKSIAIKCEQEGLL